jgi:hypothetical protein
LQDEAFALVLPLCNTLLSGAAGNNASTGSAAADIASEPKDDESSREMARMDVDEAPLFEPSAQEGNAPMPFDQGGIDMAQDTIVIPAAKKVLLDRESIVVTQAPVSASMAVSFAANCDIGIRTRFLQARVRLLVSALAAEDQLLRAEELNCKATPLLPVPNFSLWAIVDDLNKQVCS